MLQPVSQHHNAVKPRGLVGVILTVAVLQAKGRISRCRIVGAFLSPSAKTLRAAASPHKKLQDPRKR
jgi:hypothetical protein